MNYRSRSKGIRYCGSKGKCGDMVRVLKSFVRPGDVYWEPFVGAGKVIQSVRGALRVGTDSDWSIIGLLTAVQEGWVPPDEVTEEDYALWKKRSKLAAWVAHPMTGFVGYGCSFGGRFFEGYARDHTHGQDFAANAKSALLRQKPFLKTVRFSVQDYRDGYPKGESTPNVIYCDPPYAGTKPVGADKKPFDSEEFWKKVVCWTQSPSIKRTVLVSEYRCPRWVRKEVPVSVVWEQTTAASIRCGTGGDGGSKGDGTRKVEKLFLIGHAGRKVGFF